MELQLKHTPVDKKVGRHLEPVRMVSIAQRMRERAIERKKRWHGFVRSQLAAQKAAMLGGNNCNVTAASPSPSPVHPFFVYHPSPFPSFSFYNHYYSGSSTGNKPVPMDDVQSDMSATLPALLFHPGSMAQSSRTVSRAKSASRTRRTSRPSPPLTKPKPVPAKSAAPGTPPVTPPPTKPTHRVRVVIRGVD
jgi:hypothetical protein